MLKPSQPMANLISPSTATEPNWGGIFSHLYIYLNLEIIIGLAAARCFLVRVEELSGASPWYPYQQLALQQIFSCHPPPTLLDASFRNSTKATHEPFLLKPLCPCLPELFQITQNASPMYSSRASPRPSTNQSHDAALHPNSERLLNLSFQSLFPSNQHNSSPGTLP